MFERIEMLSFLKGVNSLKVRNLEAEELREALNHCEQTSQLMDTGENADISNLQDADISNLQDAKAVISTLRFELKEAISKLGKCDEECKCGKTQLATSEQQLACNRDLITKYERLHGNNKISLALRDSELMKLRKEVKTATDNLNHLTKLYGEKGKDAADEISRLRNQNEDLLLNATLSETNGKISDGDGQSADYNELKKAHEILTIDYEAIKHCRGDLVSKYDALNS